MQGRNPFFSARNALVIATMSVALAGCLSKEESESETSFVGETLSDHELTGSVGDGPIVGAKVRVLTKDGTELAQLESDGSAGYTVTVRTKGKHYPLTIDARNGIDLVTNLSPDFDLFGAALEPGKKSVANVNPFSTLAYELARDMSGGVSKSNLAVAESVVSASLNSGLSTLVETGPMMTAIDTSNIAEIVKASETLGELIRRVRDLQNIVNRPASGNSVIRAIASDLTDSVIDGRGGSRVDARVSALTVVAAVPVLLESMQNELHVYGQNATDVMTAAMNKVAGGTVDTGFEDLTVTPQMLNTVRVGLAALLAVVPSEKLQALSTAVDQVEAGMGPASVQAIIPDDYRTTLEQSLVIVAGSDDATISKVNTVSRDGGAEPAPVNNPPTIGGTPVTSVEEGTDYSFTPSASDPDGDALTFTIAGRPDWASFDTNTGQLSGAPQSGDAGTYAGIIISASDGEFTESLAEFAVTVTQPTPVPVNSAPTIGGTPATSVEEGANYSFMPSASDADGDTLTFSITGKPAWASFDTSTGALTGMPGAADVGVYDRIAISVTDSLETVSLAAFSIEVVAKNSSLGSATLTWIAPTQNEDGTELTDLAGYRLYWGTTPGTYPNSVTIDNPTVTTYIVENLSPGTYEFVATSFNTSGVESSYSEAATKVVP
jgi:hypothetical protein